MKKPTLLPNEKTPEEIIGLSFDAFGAVLAELEDKSKPISEATGALRSAIKAHLDQHGWHKSALAQIRSISAMSTTKRADFLRTFKAMFDLMMDHQWSAEMTDMINSGGDEGDE